MSIIGNYLDENVDQEADALAKALPQRISQRKSQLASAVQSLSDENALVEGIAAKLDTGPEKTAERVAYRGFVRKQYRVSDVPALSLFYQRLASNLVDSEAELLDWLIDRIATDTSSDFATLMTAITDANTARNA